jgi:hypothetical protein
MYGSAASSTKQLLSSTTTGSALPPKDWMAIAKACLGPEIIYYGKLVILSYVKNKPHAMLLMVYQLLEICS